MKRIKLVIATLTAAAAACGGSTSQATSCQSYAAELRSKALAMSTQEISVYIDDTAEHVAELIVADPNNADACADAVLEVLLSTGVDDLVQDQD